METKTKRETQTKKTELVNREMNRKAREREREERERERGREREREQESRDLSPALLNATLVSGSMCDCSTLNTRYDDSSRDSTRTINSTQRKGQGETQADEQQFKVRFEGHSPNRRHRDRWRERERAKERERATLNECFDLWCSFA